LCNACKIDAEIKYCKYCQKFISGSKCIKCNQPFNTVELESIKAKVAVEQDLVDSASLIFYHTNTDFGKCFDLIGINRKPVEELLKSYQAAIENKKKYCIYFVEVEKDYWVCVLIQIYDKWKSKTFVICPGSYTPRAIYDVFLMRINPIFLTFHSIEIINAEIHAFGVPSLISSMLSAVAILRNKDEPEKAIIEARAFWYENSDLWATFPVENPQRRVLDEKKVKSIAKSFMKRLMLNQKELQNAKASEEFFANIYSIRANYEALEKKLQENKLEPRVKPCSLPAIPEEREISQRDLKPQPVEPIPEDVKYQAMLYCYRNENCLTYEPYDSLKFYRKTVLLDVDSIEPFRLPKQ